jgi:hypothetical protein
VQYVLYLWGRPIGVIVNGGFDLNLNQPDFCGGDNWLFRFGHGRQFGVNKHLPSKGIHPAIVHESSTK